MNSCILMVEIIKEPELRYTPDNQLPIADMLVQFPSMRAEDPPSTLKVIGWGNLATEIKERYHKGDRVVIEGRLGMVNFERPEGFKEKRAELTASRLYQVGADADFGVSKALEATDDSSNSAVPFESRKSVTTPSPSRQTETKMENDYQKSGNKFESPVAQTPSAKRSTPQDLDDIPF